ncbi:MAG: putative PurR-regulated permease PerM [Candidatus Poriferisodalaceae bacterium]|jgi:predicted PurR-regulated permease PerM
MAKGASTDSMTAAEGGRPIGDRDVMPRWVPRAIGLAMFAIIGLVALDWAWGRLRSLLMMLLVSMFLSFALEPAANRLARRGWKRGTATGLVFAVVLLGLAGFVFAMGSLFADQINKLVDEAPGYITEIEVWLDDQFDLQVNTDEIVAQFSEGGAAASLASDLAGNLWSVGETVLTLLFQGLTVGLFTFYLVADGPRLRRTILSALPPTRQREVLRVWDLAIEKTGGYIYSRAMLALLAFLVHWLAFLLIDVPFPLPLALWVSVLSQFVPVIGTYIAGVLPLLIALLDDPVKAIWVLIVILAYQQLENYLLAPRITAHTMQVHPAVAFGTVIAGTALLGTVGAVLAIPAGATIQAFTSSYVRRHEVVESGLTAMTAPDGTTLINLATDEPVVIADEDDD